VGVADLRLRPLGVRVVQVQGDRDNSDQDDTDPGRLPFRDGAFPLVVDRNAAFVAAEVARILSPDGVFVTQQVDTHNHDELWRLLGIDPPSQPESWLPQARRQVESAGLTVHAAVRGVEADWFHDAGAVLYHLRAIPWEGPDLSIDEYVRRLRAADQTPGLWPVAVRQRRFLLIAGRAGPPGGQGR
jgi:SAM-dependent methyltransferase